MPDSSTPCIRVPENRCSQRVDSRDAKSASSDNCSGCPPQKESVGLAITFKLFPKTGLQARLRRGSGMLAVDALDISPRQERDG